MTLVSKSLDESMSLHRIDAFATEAGNSIAEAIKTDNEKNINEGAALLAISTVLAAPAFVKILGTLIKKGAKLFKWKGGENAGEALEKFAHKVEHKMQQPIEWILKKLGADEDKAKKWTKGIFALVIILLGVYSGVELAQAIKSANIGKSTAEGLLTGLKASETGENLMNAVRAAGLRAAAAGSKLL